MLEFVRFFLSHAFLLRALAVGVLISLCCALLGVSLVLKRFSMIGDGLSHVGFGALAIACAANIAPLYFSIPIVVAAAFLLLAMNEKGALKGDAAIALISTGALAVGVMVTSLTTGMNVDVYNYMFGSILAMSRGDVVISVILSVAVITLFLLFYDELFAVTFDESFAKATGTRVGAYNMLLAALTAVTIVVGMRMMGALLISSLIIFPTVTAMRVCKSYRRVVLTSVLVSVVCFLLGLAVSVKLEAPTGASVVCVNIFFLAVFSLFGFAAGLNPRAKLFRFRNVLRVFAGLLLLCGLLLPFFGALPKQEKDPKLSVVATSFASYDFARAVCGEDAELHMLLAPGEESHTYEPTPGDLVAIEQCDVFLYGGGESDAWANEILSSVDLQNKQIVRMMDVVELQAEELLEGMQEADEEEEEDAYDEHVWTSPANAMKITKAVCEAVCRKDPAHENAYRSRTEAELTALQKLDDAFFELAKETDRSFLVGDRFPFQYFAKRYGFRFFAAFPGCSAQSDADPATVARLIDYAKKEGIDVIFRVDLSTGSIANAIAEGANARVDTLYSCHVISAEDFAAGETYLSLMARNLRALRAAARLDEAA